MNRALAFALLAGSALGLPADAGTLRVATFDVGMSRDGPGVLVHELETGPEPATLAGGDPGSAA